MADARLLRCLDPGMSILVGTVDVNGMPACCRAVALASHDALGSVIVYVPMATSQETLANLATTHRLAVGATYPPDHMSIQLKGTTSGARLARDEEKAFVAAQRDALFSVLDNYGIPRRVLRTTAYWPAFAIDMRVEQIFEQTPGPNAGVRLK